MLLSVSAWSQSDYYGQYKTSINYLRGNELKLALRDILSSYHAVRDNLHDVIILEPIKKYTNYTVHQSRSYSRARFQLYTEIHASPSSRFFTYSPIYCDAIYNGKIKNRLTEQKLYDAFLQANITAEHVWPQDRFSKYKKANRSKDPMNSFMVSDLHNLFPSKEVVNNIRGNLRFAEVIPGSIGMSAKVMNRFNSKMDDAKIGVVKDTNFESDQMYFEPPDSAKGRVARAMMYFSVRYDKRMSAVEEFYVRKWHKEFPVTKEERIRNEKVFKVQGNRNPFVDLPHLEAQIDSF